MKQAKNTSGSSARQNQQVLAAWATGSQQTGEARLTKDYTLRRRRKLKTKDVVWVLEKLATTLGSGVPLVRALGMLGRMRDGDVVGERLGQMQEDLSDGRTLSQAMSRHTDEWSRTVISLVEAGEASGQMEANLTRAANLIDSRNKLRRKVTGAMIYPAAVLAVTTALVALLLIVVVPRFKEIYTQLDSQLPLLTRLVVAVSAYAPMFALIVAGSIIGSFVFTRRARSDDAVAARLDWLKLRIPLVGRLIEKSSVARVSATLAGLLSSGVNLLTALDHAKGVAGLRRHADALIAAREAVSDGADFSSALARTEAFPDMLVQYAAVGEQSGTLSTMMERYADTALNEVEETAANIIRLIEPLMMIVIGVVVGFFLLALYMPILTIGNQIQ